MNTHNEVPGQDIDAGRLAHDLRNALSGMYIYIQLLELSLTEKNMEKELAMLTSMSDSIKKMTEMINDQLKIR